MTSRTTRRWRRNVFRLPVDFIEGMATCLFEAVQALSIHLRRKKMSGLPLARPVPTKAHSPLVPRRGDHPYTMRGAQD